MLRKLFFPQAATYRLTIRVAGGAGAETLIDDALPNAAWQHPRVRLARRALGFGAAGLLVFWSKVGWDSLRRARHPRLLVAGALAFVLLLAALALLGVQLPRE